MPLPVALPYLIAAIPSIVKTITGLVQGSRANEYADTPRPEYEIPSGVMQSLDQIIGMSSERGLPGQDLIEENIQSSTARGIDAVSNFSRSSTDAILGMQPSIAKEQESFQNLGVAGAEQERQNQLILARALEGLGQYQDKQFQINKLMPYQYAMDAARRLSESGGQNIFSGLSDTAGIGAYMAKDYLSRDDGGKGFLDNINTGVINDEPGDFEIMDDPFKFWQENFGLTPNVTYPTT